MSTKKILTLILLLSLVSTILVGVGCEKNKSKEVIKIGAVLPLTGNLSFLGVPEKNALDIAIDDINNNGGVNGKKLKIIYEDSKGEAKIGVTAANKLLNTDKTNIIFTTATIVCIPTQKVIHDANAIQMAISMHPKLADMSDATFRVFPTGWQEAEQLVKLHKQLGSKNVAIFYGAVPEMESEVNDYLVPKLKENEIAVSLIERFSLAEQNFKPLISKIDREAVDAVILIGFGFNMPPILKEIHQSKLNIEITGGIGLMEFSGDEYAALIDSVKFIAPKVILDINHKKTDFAQKYFEKYGITPTYDALFIYDQFQVLVEALKNSNVNDVNSIKENLLKISDFNGETGNISILPNGDAIIETTAAQYQNGEIIKF